VSTTPPHAQARISRKACANKHMSTHATRNVEREAFKTSNMVEGVSLAKYLNAGNAKWYPEVWLIHQQDYPQ